MRRLLLVTAVVLAVVGLPPAAHADPDYFPLPAGYSYGQGLDVSPDGIVYFGSSRPSADPLISQRPPIGRLDPALASPGTSNGMTFLVTPPNETCCATQLRGLAWSAVTGTLYWTRSDGVVGRYDAAGGMQSVAILGHPGPWGIAAAPDGTAWFTENTADNSVNWYGNRVGQVTPGLGLNELVDLAHQTGVKDSTRYDAKPLGITVAANGTPWFAEAENGLAGYRVGSVAGGKYVEYFPPCAAGAYCSGVSSGSDGISDVAVAQDGTVWYTNELKKTVGHLIPGATVTEYSLNTMSPGLAAGRPRAL